MSNILPFTGKKFSEDLAQKVIDSEIDQLYYDLFIAPLAPRMPESSTVDTKGQLNDED